MAVIFIGAIGVFLDRMGLLTKVVREEKKLGIAVFILSIVYVFFRLSGPIWESLIFVLVQGKAVHWMIADAAGGKVASFIQTVVAEEKDLGLTLFIFSLIYVFLRLSGPWWESLIVILVQGKALHWMLPDPDEE